MTIATNIIEVSHGVSAQAKCIAINVAYAAEFDPATQQTRYEFEDYSVLVANNTEFWEE